MKMIVATEIVIVEGITSAFGSQLASLNFFKEMKRLHETEGRFELIRLDNHVVKYRNLNPTPDPKAPLVACAFIFNNYAEVISVYTL